MSARTGWSEGNGEFTAVLSAHEKLPSGNYNLRKDYYGKPLFKNVLADFDKVSDLPGLPVGFLLKQVHDFWAKESLYKKYGFVQKRGILLYGPPGCGKTCVINMLRREVTVAEGISFNVDNFNTAETCLSMFRQVEPHRPLMLVMEDLESLLETSNGNNQATNEKLALSMMDGENQQNNVLFLATTNKPELLADRFIRRPGRFDLVVGIHLPTAETREAYLRFTCNGNLKDEELKHIIERTEGLSLAYLREIAASYLVLGVPIEETLVRLRKQDTMKFKNKERGFTIGFSAEDGKAA